MLEINEQEDPLFPQLSLLKALLKMSLSDSTTQIGLSETKDCPCFDKWD